MLLLSRIPSVLRLAENEALSHIRLHGSVLDIGGDKKSAYQSLFQGIYKLTTVNLDKGTSPDIVHDLETPLPLAAASYDGVLLINVLEHIFDYRQLLSESVRVLKPEGQIVIVVPFLFPIHPSPEDYHRFTEKALRKECDLTGLVEIEIVVLGTGVFSARYVMLDRLLPWPLRLFGYITLRHVARLLDGLLSALAQLLGKKYDAGGYALGYCLTARKPLS